MSINALKQTITAPYSQLIKLKIGILVRSTLPQILKYELISETEVKKLTDYNYSKFIFDMNYAILKLVNENISLLENRKDGEYTRYYASPNQFKCSRYLITSEWYDRNQEAYIKWLKRKVHL